MSVRVTNGVPAPVPHAAATAEPPGEGAGRPGGRRGPGEQDADARVALEQPAGQVDPGGLGRAEVADH